MTEWLSLEFALVNLLKGWKYIDVYKRQLYSLGTCFEFGEGIEQDIERAFKCYEEAANQGHERSQHRLGCLLYISRCV